MAAPRFEGQVALECSCLRCAGGARQRGRARHPQTRLGSQAGFLKARVGIVLALPDPAIVILGAVQVGVPSADAPENLRIVDLRAELMAEITPDFFLLRVSLANSKIAGIVIRTIAIAKGLASFSLSIVLEP